MNRFTIKISKILIAILILCFVVFSFIFIIPESQETPERVGRESSELELQESKEGNIVRSSYVDEEGVITYATDLHYATLVKTLDAFGNVILEKYYDENGNPVQQPEGHYILSTKYDENGYNTRISYLDQNFSPIMNTSGYSFRVRAYDSKGQVVSDRYYDTEWNPVEVSTGNYAIVRAYDENGRNNVITYLGKNDELVLIKSGFARVVRTFYENGDVATEMYFGTDQKPIAIGLGQYGEAYVYDENGNKAETSYLDAAGNLMLNEDGYATVKKTYTESGDVETERFYGVNGEPVKNIKGHYGLRYSEKGTEYLDINGDTVFSFNDYLYDHPYVVLLAGFLLCFVAVLLPRVGRYIILGLYLIFILNMTLLFRETGDSQGEFTLFWSYRQFFSNHYYGTEILQNIWLFVPLGAIIRALTRKKIFLLAPFVLSVVIELIQLVFGLGLFEFDDIISNTLGGLLGYLIAWLFTELVIRWKRKLRGIEPV